MKLYISKNFRECVKPPEPPTPTPKPPTTTPENCTRECDDCGYNPGYSCQLVPGTQCTFKCLPPPTPPTPTPENCTRECDDCGYNPGHSCQLVPGTLCSVRCMRTFTAPTTLPTSEVDPTTFPTPIITTPEPPMMRIEMCLLPGNDGRSDRPLANLGMEVVVVDCRSYETCVESDNSKILGIPLG